MTIKKQLEEAEFIYLSKLATHSANSKGRLKTDDCFNELGTEFQIDREKIIRSKSFRRLMHKTQVFISPEGDHFINRLTHTLEVSCISRSVVRGLKLNEDLTEAISLGHDLGHTPFGHAGENVLNEILDNGFHHFEQSLRIIDILENEGKGLNLTFEVRDGILNHTCGTEPITLEGRIVRFCDKIAYINHDLDDAIRANIITENDIPKELFNILGENRLNWQNKMTEFLINSIKKTNYQTISMGNNQNIFDLLHEFMFKKVYLSENAKKEEKKVKYIIKFLFDYFMKNNQYLPPNICGIAERDGLKKAVCDYISGMTDKFAVNLFKELFIPKPFYFIKNNEK